MQYERFNENYPDPDARTQNGSPQSFGWYGYADYCLNSAIVRDDAPAFRFYFERYFSLDGITIGGSQALIVANKGAEKCVREPIKMGATDPSFSAEQLIERAKKSRQ